MSKNTMHILNELEKFHQDKLDEIRAKRNGHVKPPRPQELIPGSGMSMRLDPVKNELVISWGTSQS